MGTLSTAAYMETDYTRFINNFHTVYISMYKFEIILTDAIIYFMKIIHYFIYLAI